MLQAINLDLELPSDLADILNFLVLIAGAGTQYSSH
jgi:hypothetical protein